MYVYTVPDMITKTCPDIFLPIGVTWCCHLSHVNMIGHGKWFVPDDMNSSVINQCRCRIKTSKWTAYSKYDYYQSLRRLLRVNRMLDLASSHVFEQLTNEARHLVNVKHVRCTIGGLTLARTRPFS